DGAGCAYFAADIEFVRQRPSWTCARFLLRQSLIGRHRWHEIGEPCAVNDVALRGLKRVGAGQRHVRSVWRFEVEGRCEIASDGATPGRDIRLRDAEAALHEANQ